MFSSSSHKLAYNPHILGKCSHTFCRTCVKNLLGKRCPVLNCGVLSPIDAYKLDPTTEKMIEAFLPIAKYFQLPLPDVPSIGSQEEIAAQKNTIKASSSKVPSTVVVEENLASDGPSNIEPPAAIAQADEGQKRATKRSSSLPAKSPGQVAKRLLQAESVRSKPEPSPSNKRQRKTSVASLDVSTTSTTPMNTTKLQKRNAKGETPLQVVMPFVFLL